MSTFFHQLTSRTVKTTLWLLLFILLLSSTSGNAQTIVQDSAKSGTAAIEHHLRKVVPDISVLTNHSEYGQYLLTDEVIGKIKIHLQEHLTVALIVVKSLLYFLAVWLSFLISRIFLKQRKFTGEMKPALKKILYGTVLSIIGAGAVYWFPSTFLKISWEEMQQRFPALVFELYTFGAAGLMVFFLLFTGTLIFPIKNRLINGLPWYLISSAVSGLTTLVIFVLILQSFLSDLNDFRLFAYIVVLVLFSIYSKRELQFGILKYTNELVFEQRVKLLRKIFSLNFQKFEKMNSGDIYTTLNNDTEMIGNSIITIIGLVGSAIGVIAGVFMLFVISPGGTLLLLLTMTLLGFGYTTLANRANAIFEKARDTESIFVKLLEGLVKGYKELSLHVRKKELYGLEMEKVSNKYRDQRNRAYLGYIDAAVLGEGAIILVLCCIVLFFPLIFKEMTTQNLIAFVFLLIYIISPLGEVLEAMPSLGQIFVSWKRINKMTKEITGEMIFRENSVTSYNVAIEKNFSVESMQYEYPDLQDQYKFSVGPFSLSASKGQIIFLCGGNGSGKTTLAKLMTGLYNGTSGKLLIDGKAVDADDIGEYFSAVFSDYFLFDKLYNIDLTGREEQVHQFLRLLELDKKVQITGGTFSTIDLSTGQKKRLALLKCFLEDKPIYLFDEWAADQDPEFKKFFYTRLLREMKEKGKIIIAITHDDHYYHVADHIMRIAEGRVVERENNRLETATAL